MRAKLAGALATGVALARRSPLAPAAARRNGPPRPSPTSGRRRGDRSTRLVVECTGPLAYTYYSPDPLTLVVDIPEVDASRCPPQHQRRHAARWSRSGSRPWPGRRPEPGPPRGAAGQPRALPDLLQGQDAEPGLRARRRGGRGSAGAGARAGSPRRDRAPPVAEAPRRLPSAAPATAGARARRRPAVEARRPAAAGSEPRPRAARHAHPLGRARPRRSGQLAVTVRADGTPRATRTSSWATPTAWWSTSRTSRAARRCASLEVNQAPGAEGAAGPVQRGRPKVARLVLDLSARAPYRIVDARRRREDRLRRGPAAAPAPLAALRTEPEPEPTGRRGRGAGPAGACCPRLAPGAAAASRRARAAGRQCPIRRGHQPRADRRGEKVYTGHPISLDFKDGDLQDIFRLFADISGLNVVVNPGVSGKVTLKLNEVPWDQALDLILKANGLGYTLEDNVIRIAPPRPTCRRRSRTAASWRKRRRSPATCTLTHAHLLRQGRGARPTCSRRRRPVRRAARSTSTPRTNTMIIKDLPRYLDQAQELIAELDRATPQVEIEARIVVTSRNFTRDLGIQWGFLNQQTPQFGNTTNRAFPNSIVLNGAACRPTGGITAAGGHRRRRRHRPRAAAATPSTCRRPASTPRSASRWATSSAASTSTPPSPRSSARAAAACSRRRR